jgi:hypothetical protein
MTQKRNADGRFATTSGNPDDARATKGYVKKLVRKHVHYFRPDNTFVKIGAITVWAATALSILIGVTLPPIVFAVGIVCSLVALDGMYYVRSDEL